MSRVGHAYHPSLGLEINMMQCNHLIVADTVDVAQHSTYADQSMPLAGRGAGRVVKVAPPVHLHQTVCHTSPTQNKMGPRQATEQQLRHELGASCMHRTLQHWRLAAADAALSRMRVAPMRRLLMCVPGDSSGVNAIIHVSGMQMRLKIAYR